MNQKLRVCISSVNLNVHTYRHESLAPSLVNFIFGKNGSGKSTIAKAIADRAGLTWADERGSRAVMAVYNEEYIRDNIQSYGNIPGVFTMSAVNAKIKKEIDYKTEERRDAEKQKLLDEKTLQELQSRLASLDDKHAGIVWAKTEQLRKTDFPRAIGHFSQSKKKFFQELHGAMPTEHNLVNLQSMYATVFSPSPDSYTPYEQIDSDSMHNVPDLLFKPIISRSNTEFAKFVRVLGNLDWIKLGHENYETAASGKCPYCGQPLPSTFTEQLELCFDQQYKDEMQQLGYIVKRYRDTLNHIYVVLTHNKKNPFPVNQSDEAAYQQAFDMFMEKARFNVHLLDSKMKEPAIELNEFENLTPYLQKIHNVIDSINQQISDYMKLVSDIPGQQSRCNRMVWEYIAFVCKDEIEAYDKEKKELTEALKVSGEKVTALESRITTLSGEISELAKSTVNTTKAMEDINATLHGIGFRGFHLREKSNTSYVYELIREDENGVTSIAKDLSEGERNFIAFLYFYHTVMGSQSDNGQIDDKIVVIDDPVSSMDSNTLFVVASLVREMIAVCYNNYNMAEGKGSDDHIRQFFCLTHNPVFFREISYNRILDYECVSFFEITKDSDNRSHITELWEDSAQLGQGRINKTPVRNQYESLWHDFRSTDDRDTLMNAARQILDYYFIQMGGYTSQDFKALLFEGESRKAFERNLSDGSIDHAYLLIANSMIALLNVGATNFNDGLFLDMSSFSLEQMRSAMEIIFEVMNQKQHYDKMMAIK